jgi:hypothetical protein
MYGMQHFLIKDNLSRVADPGCLSRISDSTTIEKEFRYFLPKELLLSLRNLGWGSVIWK